MGMHNPVIPGRHHLVMRRLAGIPVRRDIAVLAAEHGEHLVPVRHQPVELVGNGDMTYKQAVPVAQQRNMVRDKPLFGRHNQRGKRTGIDQRVDFRAVGLGKMRRQIHHLSSGVGEICFSKYTR